MTTREAFLKSFTTNVISVHTFTETFIDLILKSPRAQIVFVTSGIGSLTTHSNPNFPINQSPPAGWPKPYQLNNTTYRTSKTAMNMMALEWKRTLRNDNVKVNLVTPGLSATAVGGTDPDVYRKFGADEPSVGGNFIRTVIEGKRDADEGIGMVMGSGVIPW